jgi:hypothetical protein
VGVDIAPSFPAISREQQFAHLHQPMPVPKQLTQIAIFRTRYPDPRKAIFHHQLQKQLSIFTVGLLLLDALRLYLGWIRSARSSFSPLRPERGQDLAPFLYSFLSWATNMIINPI